MHILIAHNDYARPSGEEHAIEMLSTLLQAHGHRITWFRRSSAEIGGALTRRIGAGLAGIWNPFSRQRMKKMLAEVQPDVVLVQNLYPLLSPSILGPCSARGIPVVMRCPNYRLYCPNGLHMTAGKVCERCLGPGRELWCLLRNCERSPPKSASYALRNAAARLSGSIHRNVSVFVVLTEFQKQRFIAQGIDAQRMVVVPNAAPPGCADVPVGGGAHVAFMGRAAPEKGLAFFLELVERCPGIPFAVAGAVKETAQALVDHAPPNVTFHGHLDGDALTRFLRNTRIMMSCSLCFEGFPNSVVQAMAAGRPVVASAMGSVAGIVADGESGWLYAPGDLEGAAAHVRALYADPTACATMGAAGRLRAAQQYHPDTVYATLMEAFECALAHQGTSVTPGSSDAV